eukprot:4567231-Karenia_brevis.AAC.1
MVPLNHSGDRQAEHVALFGADAMRSRHGRFTAVIGGHGDDNLKEMREAVVSTRPFGDGLEHPAGLPSVE